MARSPEVEHLEKAAIIASRIIKHEAPDTTEPEPTEAETPEPRPQAE